MEITQTAQRTEELNSHFIAAVKPLSHQSQWFLDKLFLFKALFKTSFLVVIFQ